jgi:hypothetical protein
LLNWSVAALILISLTSCAKKARVQKKIESNLALIQQAKIIDVPVPLGVVLDPVLASDVSVGYHWNVTAGDAAAYYHLEMAQFGWRLVDQFTGPEELLVFEKPYRSVAISIRPGQQAAVQVLILVKYKN